MIPIRPQNELQIVGVSLYLHVILIANTKFSDGALDAGVSLDILIYIEWRGRGAD